MSTVRHSPEGVNPKLALACMERVLSSATFARSDRLRRFLRHIVVNGLNADAGRLKETSIGSEVFDRPATYDPKIDPIVRIEARRLRIKLQEYYDGEGNDDPLIIELPKGGYTPLITIRPGREPSLSVPDPEPPPRAPVNEVPAAPVSFPKPSGRGNRIWPYALPAATIAAIAIAFVLLRSSVQPVEMKVVAITDYPGNEFQPAISPDGKRMAFVWDGGQGNYDLYVKEPDTENAIRLTTDPGHDLAPSWSPDGTQIAYLRITETSQDVMVVSAFGGTQRRVTSFQSADAIWLAEPVDNANLPRPVWVHDSAHLAIVDADPSLDGRERIFQVALDGSDRRPLTSPPPGTRDTSPAVSPDGQKLAFVRRRSLWRDDLYVMPLRGGAPRQITFEGEGLRGIAWAGNNSSLIAAFARAGTGAALWRISLSGEAPQALTEAGRNVMEPSVSLDGTRILYMEVTHNTNIWRVAPESTTPARKLIASSRRSDSAQYSPDGKSIVFMSTRSGHWEIWRSDAEGNQQVQLTHFGGPQAGSLRWSPDGTRIAFDVTEHGISSIYVMGADGSGLRRITEPRTHNWIPTWSQDGKSLYYTSAQGAKPTVWKQLVDGGPAEQLPLQDAKDVIEDPTGKFLYFSKGVTGVGLYRMARATGQVESVPEMQTANIRRYWNLISRGIFFVYRDLPPREIRFFDFATEKARTVATIERPIASGTPSLSASPDGKWLIYAQVDYGGRDIMMLDSRPAESNAPSKAATRPAQLSGSK